MRGGKLLPKAVIMHFTGATDYSADVFLSGPAVTSRTTIFWIIQNTKKVAYKAFISVSFGWLECSLVTLSDKITQTFSTILSFKFSTQITCHRMTISRKVLWNCIAKQLCYIPFPYVASVVCVECELPRTGIVG